VQRISLRSTKKVVELDPKRKKLRVLKSLEASAGSKVSEIAAINPGRLKDGRPATQAAKQSPRNQKHHWGTSRMKPPNKKQTTDINEEEMLKNGTHEP